jgi:DNA helicase-2/ATP-dependent DNA helicase PcrA
MSALADIATALPASSTVVELAADLKHRSDNEDEPSVSAVTLSTVHRVKGREWPHVIVVGLDAGVMPHRLSDDHEEERRILHVALTRAQRQLTLIADRTRPSPFLPELLGELRCAPDAPDPQDVRLLAALHAWRRRVAAEAGVPAFLIAHDRTLAGVSARRPASPEALRACRGIGPVTAERYGGQILRIVRSEGLRATTGTGCGP